MSRWGAAGVAPVRWLRDRLGAGRRVRVGWVIDPGGEATFVFPDPRPVAGDSTGAAPEAGNGPFAAAASLARRLFAVPCPFDLRLRLHRQADGTPALADVAPARSGVAPDKLARLVEVMRPHSWRHAERPVIQIATPYRFVADVPVYLNQIPACLDPADPPLPGTLICGRFPTDVWPRRLMWAFEWHDPSAVLELRRGRPWFYVLFDTLDPAARVELVPARWTEGLAEYCRGLDGVSTMVGRTFSLFATARERRPRRLLLPR